MVAAAMARDLTVFVVPGSDIAREHGLDVAAAGLRPVASPRHASVLLVVGDLPAELRAAASVVYAQMMRPRALLVLGAADRAPLPAADVAGALSQQGLIDSVTRLRHCFREGAFREDAADFTAPALQTRVEYTCPMHPEVVSDQPGSCPKCGMTLVPREAAAGSGHSGHDAHSSADDTGSRKTPDQAHMGHNHAKQAHTEQTEYTCPMHPEVVSEEPGSCPKCGMDLVPAENKHNNHSGMDHGAMDHDSMNHGNASFMSMVDVTKDLPRSGDELQMDWMKVAFGPFFPGLPGGLMLTFTLDGDTVAEASVHGLAREADFPTPNKIDAAGFADRLAGLEQLVPVAYRLLACRATEDAAGTTVSTRTAQGRIGALERERVVSHLGWLALTGQQSGFIWLAERAATLQAQVRSANVAEIANLKPAVERLIDRIRGTGLQRARLAGLGRLAPHSDLRGPVSRASAGTEDARNDDGISPALGFVPICRDGGDALSRMLVRLDEIAQSLALIAAAGAIELPEPEGTTDATGHGTATVETPRGVARMDVALEHGKVVNARVDAPSTPHLALAATLCRQHELGDALTIIGSLDISPWETRL